MKIGSLFAGIGGFDLAARWMGWTTAWVSEIEPYASAVLKKHFPEAPNLGDITKITKPPTVDLLCGGFPCQDISLAGKGAGIEGERSGLWKEYARLIGEIRPKWVVAENVSALRSRGLGVVLGDLHALGYDVEWHCIPASYVGAPHRRDRIWIIARDSNTDESGLEGRIGLGVQECAGERSARSLGASMAYTAGIPESEPGHEAEALGGERDAWMVAGGGGSRLAVGHPRSPVADSASVRWGEECSHSGRCGKGSGPEGSERCGPELCCPMDNSLCRRYGTPEEAVRTGRSSALLSGWWLTEPDVGRVAHGVPSRVDRLRCLGNAIVPQVAYLIFQAIAAHEARHSVGLSHSGSTKP